VIAALIIPVDGKSYPLIAVTAAGYLLAALAYGRYGTDRSRQEPDPPGPSSPASGGTDSPSASAQRSSS
jgi:hypothetical protein